MNPPATRVDVVVDCYHGTQVADPYRWLEGDTPEVAAWTEAQNAYWRQALDAWPGRRRVEAELLPLMEVGEVSLPVERAGRYFYSRREGNQNQAVIYWRTGHDGPDRVLIDPAVLDPSGLTTVEWVSAAPGGALAAYGTYRAGDENTTLRVIRVDTGERLPVEIPGKTEAAQWLPDASGFVYRHLRDASDPYSGQIRFHRLGSDTRRDPVLFRQFTPEEDPVLATTWGPLAQLSDDGRWLLLGYWRDTVSTDLWLVDFEEYLRTGVVERREIAVGVDGHGTGTVIEGTLFLHTTKGAPRGRVIAVNAATPHIANWRDLVPERDDVLEAVTFARGCLVATYLHHASSVAEVISLDGAPRGVLQQPGLGSVVAECQPWSTECFFQFSSFVDAPTIYRADLAKPSSAPAIWAQAEVPGLSGGRAPARVTQVWYPSKDGTPISMFLVTRDDFVPAGDAPTLLYGYGGFSISLTPAFNATLVPWIAAGGVLAVPNLRGGGEYGDAWHQAGMLHRKPAVFEDFIAAAEWLVANRYTTAERLAIAGGSNGGLLTGAVLTARPDLCRAVVCAVPLLDMLRYQHFLMARYWVPEYGSSEDPALFPVLKSYSPYHRVAPGTAYPAVLLSAGEHDTRVHPMHARKMAAALQAATSSDPARKPVLLWVDREAGHGQGKPLSLRLRDAVDQRVFLMWQLGVPAE